MNIETKYDMGQKIWAVGTYDTEPKKCSHCGHDIPFVRYRVLPKTRITRFSVHSILYFGFLITYENNKQSRADENKIDCAGGIWFTTPQAAQAECDRRNRKGENL